MCGSFIFRRKSELTAVAALRKEFANRRGTAQVLIRKIQTASVVVAKAYGHVNLYSRQSKLGPGGGPCRDVTETAGDRLNSCQKA